MEVTGINILADQNHLVYRPSKGTVDRLLKISTHAHPRRTRGQSSSQAPGSSVDPSKAGPSSSRGPSRAPGKKKGMLNFISRGLFACFNIGKHNAEEIHAHRQYVDEQLLKIEMRQKALMAKSDIEHSPVRAPMEFPPPPVFYNPWGEMGDFSSIYGGPPPFNDVDFGGREGSDGEDEGDVPAADTPSDEDAGGDDDDE